MKNVLFILLSLCIATASVYGQKTWLGITSDWHHASNWIPTGVPSSMDDVTIPTTANDPVLSITSTINSLDIDSGAACNIDVNGKLLIRGTQGLAGLRTKGSLTNSGLIFIDDLSGGSDFGIWVDASGSVNNAGTITIGSYSATGNTGIQNLGTFYNSLDGNILVVNAGQSGIGNGRSIISSNATFINKGYIGVGIGGSITKNGIVNANLFTNKKPGLIEISNTSNFGMVNSGDFYNYHNIEIDAPPSMGLNNMAGSNVNDTLAEFINAPCATISLSGRIFNMDQIINNGFFSLLPVSDPSLTGQLINNGVMAEAGAYLPTTGGLVNNEIIIRPLETISCGTIPSVFDLSSTTHLKIAGIYTDPSATNSAGNYDLVANTFSPTIAVGTYTLYVKIIDYTNKCDAILPWEFTLLPVIPDAQCQNISVSLNAQGYVELDPYAIDAGSSDTCGIASFSVTPASLTCNDLGLNDVSLTVVNSAGNASTCYSKVTVLGKPCSYYNNIRSVNDHNNTGRASNSISISPNPVRQSLTVNLEEWTAERVALRLMDQIGRLLWQRDLVGMENRSITIDVSRFPAGIYILSCNAGHEYKTQRVVVTK